MILSRHRIVLNYILTYLIIAFSGIPIFDGNKLAKLVFAVFLGAIFLYNKKKIGKELYILIAIIIFLVLFQSFYFGGGQLFTTIVMISMVILTPYFAIKLIGPKVLMYYRDVMVFIALTCLVFWIAVNVFPPLHSAIQVWAIKLAALTNSSDGFYNENIIIYTYEHMQVSGMYRNSGSFHEPGAYAVFLILALISETFVTGKFLTRNNILFLISIISTFSTAGFLGMFILVSFFVFSSKRMTFLTKIFVSGSILAIVIYFFITLDFLGEKIENQMEEQSNLQLNTPTYGSGRFIGARKAFIVIYRHPLIGRGILADFKAKDNSEEASGYGWITWVAEIGLIFGSLYLYYFYKAIRNYSIVNLKSKKFALFAFVSLLAVLAGQSHTNHNIFFMIFLVPIIFPIAKYLPDYSLKL